MCIVQINIRYLRVILDDWSRMPDFVTLQFYLQSSNNSLVQGVFDESSDLYKHFWRQRALNLKNSFVYLILEKLRPYAQEKWYNFYCVKKNQIFL